MHYQAQTTRAAADADRVHFADLRLIDLFQSGRARRDPAAGRWHVLLDAAKLAATSVLDLSVHRPDFVAVSFYKMFGYPTGLGAKANTSCASGRCLLPQPKPTAHVAGITDERHAVLIHSQCRCATGSEGCGRPAVPAVFCRRPRRGCHIR